MFGGLSAVVFGPGLAVTLALAYAHGRIYVFFYVKKKITTNSQNFVLYDGLFDIDIRRRL